MPVYSEIYCNSAAHKAVTSPCFQGGKYAFKRVFFCPYACKAWVVEWVCSIVKYKPVFAEVVVGACNAPHMSAPCKRVLPESAAAHRIIFVRRVAHIFRCVATRVYFYQRR